MKQASRNRLIKLISSPILESKQVYKMGDSAAKTNERLQNHHKRIDYVDGSYSGIYSLIGRKQHSIKVVNKVVSASLHCKYNQMSFFLLEYHANFFHESRTVKNRIQQQELGKKEAKIFHSSWTLTYSSSKQQQRQTDNWAHMLLQHPSKLYPCWGSYLIPVKRKKHAKNSLRLPGKNQYSGGTVEAHHHICRTSMDTGHCLPGLRCSFCVSVPLFFLVRSMF